MKISIKKIIFIALVIIVLCSIGLGLYFGLGKTDNGQEGGDNDNPVQGPESLPFEYVLINDIEGNSGYSITNMNIDCSENGILTIPESYNGLPIIGIASLNKEKLDDNNAYNTNITEIRIPKSVKFFDGYTFMGMTGLTKVVFEQGNNITEIPTCAFKNCFSLSTIENLDNITKIETQAFYNCSSLLKFNFSEKVDFIEATAFVGCTSLTSFSVHLDNPVFCSIDGVIFNKQGTGLLNYPQGKTETAYVVPDLATEIMGYAIYGNKYLKEIDLNNVVMIRRYGLAECSNLSMITTNNLDFLELDALEGTSWLQNQTTEIIKLGNVLVSYTGTESELEITGIMSIAPRAFAGNKTLQKITLNEAGYLRNIGAEAFCGCDNLREVYLLGNNIVYVSSTTFDKNSNLKIYVPHPLLQQYLNNQIWQAYNTMLQA